MITLFYQIPSVHHHKNGTLPADEWTSRYGTNKLSSNSWATTTVQRQSAPSNWHCHRCGRAVSYTFSAKSDKWKLVDVPIIKILIERKKKKTDRELYLDFAFDSVQTVHILAAGHVKRQINWQDTGNWFRRAEDDFVRLVRLVTASIQEQSAIGQGDENAITVLLYLDDTAIRGQIDGGHLWHV